MSIEQISKNVSLNFKLTDEVSNPAKKINWSLVSMTTAVVGLGSKLASINGSEFVGSFMEFEKGMSALKMSTGATTAELTKLSESARNLGATTILGTADITKAMDILARDGRKAAEISEMIGGIANLSIAGESDIIETASSVNQILTAFNLTAKDTAKVTDILSTETGGDMLGLAEGLKAIAPNFSSLGISLNEASAMLSMLADAGLDGSAGGMALNSMLKNIKAPSKELSKYMRSLGVSVYDASGNFRSMFDIISEVSTATEGMSKQKQTEIFSKIFGEKGSKGILTLLNQGPDKMKEFLDSYKEIGGNTSKMAGMRVDNLAGDLSHLNSSMDALKITINDSANGSMRFFVSTADMMVGSVNELAKGVPILGGAFGLLATGFNVALGPMSQLFVILPGLVMMMRGLGAAVMWINPWVRAITLLAGAIGILYANWDKLTSISGKMGDTIGNWWGKGGLTGSGGYMQMRRERTRAMAPEPITAQKMNGSVGVDVNINSEGRIKSVESTATGIASLNAVETSN